MRATRGWSSFALVCTVLLARPAGGQQAEVPLATFTARVADPDREKAWAAVVELGALALESHGKKELDKLAQALENEFQAAEAEDARSLLAHALGALRQHGASAAPELAKSMASDRSPAVRLACTLALARTGSEGAKASLRHFTSEELVGAALACAVIAETRPTKGLARLETAAEEASELRGYLASEPALLALERLGAWPPDFLPTRKKKLEVLRVPRGPFNWAGLVSAKADGILRFGKMLGASEPLKEEEFILPESLRCSQSGRAIDVYADGLGQLVNVTRDLLPPLRDGQWTSWAGHQDAVGRWQRTLGLLMEIEAKLVPRR
jgi:hypothetical protein